MRFLLLPGDLFTKCTYVLRTCNRFLPRMNSVEIEPANQGNSLSLAGELLRGPAAVRLRSLRYSCSKRQDVFVKFKEKHRFAAGHPAFHKLRRQQQQ